MNRYQIPNAKIGRARKGRAILWIMVLLTLLLTACDANNADSVTYVVITGEVPSQNVDANGANQQVALQQAQATPAPQPSPTPDVPPDVMLNVANRYFLNGYFENAVTTYQDILLLGDQLDAETRASALFGVGRAALRAGLFSTAVDGFNTLISLYPSDFRTHQSFFLRGDAYMGVSNWEAAISDFQQYLSLRPGWIDSWVYERIGDAQLALGQFAPALASYDLATQSNRSLVPQLALREKVAQVYLNSGRTDDAIAQYDAILAVAQNGAYRAQIEFQAAESMLAIGETDLALERLSQVFNQYQSSPYAYRAMLLLNENGIAINSYTEGRVNYFSEQYAAAIEAFNRFTTGAALTEIPAELYLLIGQSYRAVGNSAAAQVAFQTIIEQFPTDVLFGEALLEQGRTYFLDGDIDTAITRYLAIADTYTDLRETAAEALWRAGYLHATNERPVEARAIFQRLAATYPNTTQATSGLFIAASAATNAGDTLSAETLYGTLAATASGTDQASAYLSVGRLALQRGDTTNAQVAFSRASEAAPDSYFSARATDLLAGRAPFTAPLEYVFEFDDVADITTAENWLRATFAITQEGPLWPLSATLEDDGRIRRGRELWTMGLYDEAETEFFDILETYQNDALASYQLAVFLRGLGIFYPSQVGAANVINAANMTTLDAPAYIARMRYPVYYLDVVLRVAEENNFDPLLMFSLIRHESLFDTNATAAAGEKGLTQVIPGTADYIAGELNWPDYQHSDLFRPYAGIEFGAFYLSEQLNRFDYNAYAALAGYNAGPGRAIDWLALSGGDPDLFMSTITIATTQLYIQRIYSHYAIYRTLYGKDA
ncbi:MAG: tetratricopeptide repeat protein [Aggregatilineales bacterium]